MCYNYNGDSMIENITSNVSSDEVYDVISNKYIEIDKILELINESSLDHVTNFSNGKKEYVYHYKVMSLQGLTSLFYKER